MTGGGLDALEGLDGLNLDGGGELDEYLPTFEDLTPFEVEHFVTDLKELKLQEVGSGLWLTHHERLEKMNWTAHNQAKEGYDEYVVDQMNTLEKMPTLIYDLILIEVWKERIWPLVKSRLAKFSSLRNYIPVYHEATVCNLLEICLFHRTSCEEAGDALIDLVDYCVRKLRYLLCTPNSELVRQITSAKEAAEWDDVRNLDQQFVECEFQVCMCVISILRFLTDHRVAMPLAVTTRLLETHDVLMLLVPLMEKAPWVRRNKLSNRIEKFEEHQWQKVDSDDEGRLPKLHTQVWLTIYNLLMDPECRGRYELTSFRRETLLGLRRFINEVVVDQLPPLTNLHRSLEELSISGSLIGGSTNAAASTPFVVEMVAEAREMLVKSYEGKWEAIAEQQMRDVFTKETPEELKRLANMVSVPKELLEEGPPDDPAFTGSAASAGGSSKATGANAAEAAAWEALLEMPVVRSTASFFAAAQAAQAPPDEVLLLSVMDQAPPGPGKRLRLELRRTRRGQLGSSGGMDRMAADAKLLAQGARQSETFAIVADADGEKKVQTLSFVSQKGAARAAQQLRDLLEKPGREGLLAMYTDDVAEFSVPVVSEGGGSDNGLSVNHARALPIAS